MIGLYKARRMDTGDWVVGNLIYEEGSAFTYILTKENKDKMYVDELSNGRTTCNLIRVLSKEIIQL